MPRCACQPNPIVVCRLLYASPVPLRTAVDIAEHPAPVFAAQPAAAATCEAALRAQLLDAAPAAGSSSRSSQPERLLSDEGLAGLARDLATLVCATTAAAAAARASAAAAAARASTSSGRQGGSSNNSSSGVVLPPALMCLLVSCLKVNSHIVTAAAARGALCAASQAGTVLGAAVLLCPAALRAEGGANSTAAAPLQQLLQNGSLSWAVLAARALFCIGQALAQGGDVTSSLQGQGMPLSEKLLDLCDRGLTVLGRQLKQLQPQLPAAEVDRWLQTAAAVTPTVVAARSAAAAGGSSSGSNNASVAALGRQLQALGSLAATLLPSPHVCNKPACVTISAPGAAAAGVSGLSEKALLAKGRCSGCQISRYCTKSCLAAHWKEGHKVVCKLLQAGSGAS